MELLYKLLSTRLDLYQESMELLDRVVKIPDLAPQIKKRLSHFKTQEKYIQVHEDEHIQLLTGRKDFSKYDRQKFQRVSMDTILKICPQITRTNITRYPLDGKNRTICLVYIALFQHLQQAEKTNEIKAIYDNKLYQQMPLVPVLMWWLIQVARKLLSDQFKSINNQLVQLSFKQVAEVTQSRLCSERDLRVFSYQQTLQFDPYNQPSSANTSMISHHQGFTTQGFTTDKIMNFKKYLKNIKSVLPDVGMDSISPQILQATIKYRSLLLRNTGIKKSIDQYLQINDIYFKPATYKEDPNIFGDQSSINQGFNFWFTYTYSSKPKTPMIDKRPRSSYNDPTPSPKLSFRIVEQPPQTATFTLKKKNCKSDKHLFLPLVTRSFENFNLKSQDCSQKNIKRLQSIESYEDKRQIYQPNPYRQFLESSREQVNIMKNKQKKLSTQTFVKQTLKSVEPHHATSESQPKILEIIYEKRKPEKSENETIGISRADLFKQEKKRKIVPKNETQELKIEKIEIRRRKIQL